MKYLEAFADFGTGLALLMCALHFISLDNDWVSGGMLLSLASYILGRSLMKVAKA